MFPLSFRATAISEWSDAGRFSDNSGWDSQIVSLPWQTTNFHFFGRSMNDFCKKKFPGCLLAWSWNSSRKAHTVPKHVLARMNSEWTFSLWFCVFRAHVICWGYWKRNCGMHVFLLNQLIWPIHYGKLFMNFNQCINLQLFVDHMMFCITLKGLAKFIWS